MHTYKVWTRVFSTNEIFLNVGLIYKRQSSSEPIVSPYVRHQPLFVSLTLSNCSERFNIIFLTLSTVYSWLLKFIFTLKGSQLKLNNFLFKTIGLITDKLVTRTPWSKPCPKAKVTVKIDWQHKKAEQFY